MTAAMSLFFLLWSLVSAQTTFLPDAPLGKAWMDCPAGRPVVHIAANAELKSWNHELVHAADCLDDGKMNGSYGLTDEPTFTFPYCLQPVELPACAAEFDPDGFLAWETTR